jgi:hypothetical protein
MRRSATDRSRAVHLLGGILGAIAVTTSSAASYAQEPASPAEGAPSVTPAVPDQPVAAPTPPAPPGAPAPATAATATPEPPPAHSDLDVEARRWAIGYAGMSQVPVGSPIVQNITAPAIGVRYWASPRIGIDFAVGFSWAGGSVDAGGMVTDKDSVSGFLVQAGVPFALSTHRHVSFQVIPYVAFAQGQTTSGTGTAAIDFSGLRFDVGARSGLELFFGFIGIPELSLSATVGLQLEVRRYKFEAADVRQYDTTAGLSTTVQNNPWDIFAGNVAARYYF